ncbi:hypothetical protein MFIFM68171_10828 [Madurella fahalii]|uniref:Cytochrome P450 n=1 Tax=Madurella fahalii TaxID=1157608 RepID=A0ABQ0GSA5_9PEZI
MSTCCSNAAKIGGRLIVLYYLGLGLLLSVPVSIFAGLFLAVLDEAKLMLLARIEGSEERDDLIGPIIKAYKNGNLAFQDVLNSANSLVTAGAESTAWTLSALFYCLSANPGSLTRLIEEVRSTFQESQEISLSKTEKLAYLNTCIKEALRLYPALSQNMPRVTVSGVRVIAEVHAIVSISPYVMSHFSRNFSEPFAFRPERFLGDARFAQDKLDASQPFSSGPRSCASRNLFYASSRLIVSKLLCNFDVEPITETESWGSGHKVYLLFQHRPLRMRLKPANRRGGHVLPHLKSVERD